MGQAAKEPMRTPAHLRQFDAGAADLNGRQGGLSMSWRSEQRKQIAEDARYAMMAEEQSERHRRASNAYVARTIGLGLDENGNLLPPTWEAQRLAQVRDYEAVTRMNGLGKLGVTGVEAVVAVHKAINDNQPMHPALENELRELEEETVAAARFIIRRHAGYC